jgi:Cu(I)/Ag(I) efflux system periplasmic protein CusF
MKPNPMKLCSTLLLALAGTAFAATHLTDAEVRKVDKAAGKITLKHGEIKNLDMPAMTMVFGVKDKALLDKVKAGDMVRFAAEKEGGQFVVTTVEPAK